MVIPIKIMSTILKAQMGMTDDKVGAFTDAEGWEMGSSEGAPCNIS